MSELPSLRIYKNVALYRKPTDVFVFVVFTSFSSCLKPMCIFNKKQKQRSEIVYLFLWKSYKVKI